jgi:hypothetical protein
MKGFIEVKYSVNVEDEKVYDGIISVDSILGLFHIEDKEDVCSITFKDNTTMVVKETYDDIKNKIELAIA